MSINELNNIRTLEVKLDCGISYVIRNIYIYIYIYICGYKNKREYEVGSD